jgi:hypothetical protein
MLPTRPLTGVVVVVDVLSSKPATLATVAYGLSSSA